MLMGWFDMHLVEAGRVTLPDLEYYLLAREVKAQFYDSLGAKAGMHAQRAGATKKSGKSYVSAYSSYRDYYDDVAELEQIFNPTNIYKEEKKMNLADMNRRLQRRDARE